ncbi:MAG: metallopeptidase family protein [Gammaproteobacteria bacterium]|nr:metallopeptidase family protein [Gammaproteobacteria bacterium]
MNRSVVVSTPMRTSMHEIAHYLGIDDDHLGETGWG